MARKKSRRFQLLLFSGREARLNRAILQTLTAESPQTKYEIYKNITKIRTLKATRYSNVNTRVRVLEDTGFVRNSGLKETKAGFKANLYEVTSRAYFAMSVSSLCLDDLIRELDEISVLTLLAMIAGR